MTTKQDAQERISPDEMAYHLAVIAAQREAQTVTASWARHLTLRYGLGPDDRIGEDGAIQRAMADRQEGEG